MVGPFHHDTLARHPSHEPVVFSRVVRWAILFNILTLRSNTSSPLTTSIPHPHSLQQYLTPTHFNNTSPQLLQQHITPTHCSNTSPPLRLQMNRGYKKTNRNTDLLLMIFVSYSQIWIFINGIRIRMIGIQIFKKPIPFIRNRIQKTNRIFRIQTNMIVFIRI